MASSMVRYQGIFPLARIEGLQNACARALVALSRVYHVQHL